MQYRHTLPRLLTLVLLSLTPFFLTAQTWQWAKTFGGPGGSDMGTDQVVDNVGNVYTLSVVYTSVNFGSGAVPTNGGGDVLVTKHDVGGQLTWYKLLGGNGGDSGNGMTIDSTGNLYITGRFWNTMVCGPDTLVSLNQQDVFIVKIDNNGQVIWGRQAGSSGTGTDSGFNVAFSYSDNSVVATGYISPNAAFGPFNVTGSSAYICKLDANGNWQWAYAVGTANNDFGNALIVDAPGNIYLTGRMSSNMYLRKYTSAGSQVWTSTGSSSSTGNDVDIDQAGNLYVTGGYSLPIYFGSVYLPGPSGDGGFLVKFSPSGIAQWGNDLAGNTLYANRIDVSPAGDIYVAGSFETSLYTDTTFFFDIYFGGYEGYVVKYAANGMPVWMKQVGTDQSDILYGVNYHAGKVYITGYVGATPNGSFGSLTITNYGVTDILVAQFDDCTPPTTQVTPGFYVTGCEGDTIYLYSSTTSGAYTYQWQANGIPLGGENGTTLAIPGDPGNSGAYAMQVTSAGCSYTSHYVGVFIYPLPVVNITPASYGPTCSRDSVQLSATMLAQHTYQWLWNNAPIAGATGATYTAQQSGNYQVIVTSSMGCIDTTDAGMIYIGQYPSIVAWGDTVLCQGPSIVPLNASGATTYSWSPAASVANPTQASTTASPSVTTTYTVTGTTSGCTDTAYVLVQIGSIPQPGITYNGYLLSCTNSYASYQWYCNSTLVPGAIYQVISPPLNGSYYVVVTDSLGCSGSSNVLSVINSGIDDPGQPGGAIAVYPHPLVQSAVIHLPYTVPGGEVQLFSVDGKLVSEKRIGHTDQFVLYRDGLASGLYVLKVVVQGEVLVTRILVE